MIDEIECGLSGLRNSLSLLSGEDLEQCRLELLGMGWGLLPGGYAVVQGGMGRMVEAMERLLPEGAVKTNRKVRRKSY